MKYVLYMLGGAAIGALLISILKSIVNLIANSKSVKEGADLFHRTMSGYIKTPMLTSIEGSFGSVFIEEDHLFFEIADKFMKPVRFKVPYDRVIRCELCGEYVDKGVKPEMDDYPDSFVVEFIMDDGSRHNLEFNLVGVKKDFIAVLYPTNMLKVVEQRIEEARNVKTQTSETSEIDS